MKKESNYFKPLTGLRAIAAFMVFFMHFNPAPADSFGFRIFSQFYTGVSVFFVLSGFLITFRYANTFSFTAAWFSKYLKNRVARIYPLYIILTTVTFFATLYNSSGSEFGVAAILKQNLLVYFTNITFIRGYLYDHVFTLVSQGWSLTVEETFYFIAPLMWLYKRKVNLFVQVLIFLGMGYLLVAAGRVITFHGFFATDVFMLKFTYFGRAIQFVAGMIVGFAVLRNREINLGIKKTYVGLVLMAVSLILLAILWNRTSIYLSISIDLVLLSAGVCLLISGLISEKTVVSWFLSTNVMELLGKSSYAFYLIHLGVFNTLLEAAGIKNLWLQFIILNLISIGCFKLIESPLRSFILKKNFGVSKRFGKSEKVLSVR